MGVLTKNRGRVKAQFATTMNGPFAVRLMRPRLPPRTSIPRLQAISVQSDDNNRSILEIKLATGAGVTFPALG